MIASRIAGWGQKRSTTKLTLIPQPETEAYAEHDDLTIPDLVVLASEL